MACAGGNGVFHLGFGGAGLIRFSQVASKPDFAAGAVFSDGLLVTFLVGRKAVALAFAVVEVEDHGPGISAEDLPYIFDRYYRSRSDAGKQGTGLGLSITKAIFQQHGFRFGVHSTVGKGTVFWFIMTDTEDATAQ